MPAPTLKGKGLLTPIQKEFLAIFAALPDQDQFYLTGGTCLAEFYLGHRLSFDLDLFTSETDLILPFSYQVETACPRKDLQISVTRRFATFVEFLVTGGEETLRVDLGLDSPFRFETPVPSEYGVRVNTFKDLKADKLLAYYGRAEPRDAVDLYFLLQEERVDSMLALAAQKDPGFDLYWFAVALNRATQFPDELQRWPVKMLVEFDPLKLKQAFQELALDLMSKLTTQG
jgi:hypothetical protein